MNESVLHFRDWLFFHKNLYNLMIERLIKKTVRGIGILLAMTAVILGAITLRFAIYAPELLNDVFRTIGG